MKFAITGHTRGLGYALSQKPQVINHFIGFARTNGYDIAQTQDRSRIVEAISDCDVFINNAHAGHSQTDLLYDVYKSWENKNKLIINIGSSTTSGIKDHVWPYSSQKASLEKASEQLSFLPNPCQVMLIKFGWVGSERVLSQFNPKSYITLSDAADFILDQIKWNQKYQVVSTLLMPVP